MGPDIFSGVVRGVCVQEPAAALGSTTETPIHENGHLTRVSPVNQRGVVELELDRLFLDQRRVPFRAKHGLGSVAARATAQRNGPVGVELREPQKTAALR